MTRAAASAPFRLSMCTSLACEWITVADKTNVATE
jgi:hypothetical protein